MREGACLCVRVIRTIYIYDTYVYTQTIPHRQGRQQRVEGRIELRVGHGGKEACGLLGDGMGGERRGGNVVCVCVCVRKRECVCMYPIDIYIYTHTFPAKKGKHPTCGSNSSPSTTEAL